MGQRVPPMGVEMAGGEVHTASKRGEFLGRRPKPARPRAEELDVLVPLRNQAEKAMLAEAKRHPEDGLVPSCPGLGPVRTAKLVPIVVTPYRLQSERAFNHTLKATFEGTAPGRRISLPPPDTGDTVPY